MVGHARGAVLDDDGAAFDEAFLDAGPAHGRVRLVRVDAQVEPALLADSFDVDTSWAERLIDLIDEWGIVP